jgi:hypothetical protein
MFSNLTNKLIPDSILFLRSFLNNFMAILFPFNFALNIKDIVPEFIGTKLSSSNLSPFSLAILYIKRRFL